MIIMTSSFSKRFASRRKCKDGFKSVSEKLRFRDGLVWTVDLTVKIKLHFQIFKIVEENDFRKFFWKYKKEVPYKHYFVLRKFAVKCNGETAYFLMNP